MTLYSFEERLKSATSSSEYASVAECAINTQQDVALGKQLFLKALYEGESFFDFSGMLECFYRLKNCGYSFDSMEKMEQACLQKIEELITQFLAGEYEYDQELAIVETGSNFHRMGFEKLAIKFFHLGCFKQRDQRIPTILEYATEILDLDWNTHQAEAHQLVEKIKSLVIHYQDSEIILHFEKRPKHNWFDLNWAAERAIQLGLDQCARRLYEASVMDALSSEKIEWTISALAEIAAEIAKKELLHDRKWALELFQQAIELAENHEEYKSILFRLRTLNNPSIEAQILEGILKKDETILSDLQYLIKITTALSDSPLKVRLLTQSANQIANAYQAFDLIDSIHANPSHTPLLQGLTTELPTQQDYLLALLDRYVLENQVSLEELHHIFSKAEDINILSEYQQQFPSRIETHWTLLMRSCFYGRNQLVHMLLDMGADMSITSDSGFNALIASLSFLNLKPDYEGGEIEKEIIFRIMKSGIDLKSVYTYPNQHKISAFTEAACDGYLDVVQELYAMGASYEVNEDRGRTALFAAAYTCRIEVLHFLLEIGADASTIQDCPSFWHYNHNKDEQEVIRILRNAGATITDTDPISY